MEFYSLLIGVLVAFITGTLCKDWASGVAGFLYGGILLWAILIAVKIIKQFI
tara:strand:- start:27 stop:182 length:156 start_codon:yes stop_codon:yes gene_type:complete